MILDSKCKSRKCIGYVLFQDKESLAKALKKSLVHEIEGVEVECERAMLREELKKALMEEAKMIREKKKMQKKRLKDEKKRKKLEMKRRKQKIKWMKKQIKEMQKEESKKIKSSKVLKMANAEKATPEEELPERVENLTNVHESYYTIGETDTDKASQIPNSSESLDQLAQRRQLERIEGLLCEGDRQRLQFGIGKSLLVKRLEGKNQLMGYPTGLFHNSFFGQNVSSDEGSLEIEGKSGKSIPVPGFGAFRDLNFKTQSVLLKQDKLLNSLIELQCKSKRNKSHVPVLNSGLSQVFEDDEVEIEVGSFIMREKEQTDPGSRNYSAIEDVDEEDMDNIEKFMMNFEKL